MTNSGTAPHPEYVGHFRVLRLLDNQGAICTSLLVQDMTRPDQAPQVLKLRNPATADDECHDAYHNRLIAAWERSDQIQSDRIVRICHVGIYDGRSYCVMNYVAGMDLAAYVEGKVTSFADYIHLIINIAKSVSTIHSKGFVHRDLKPTNIRIREADGVAVILDLDYLFRPGNDLRATATNRFLGTPLYSAPEQHITSRRYPPYSIPSSDVFSLGVVFYELLAKNLPFTSLDSLVASNPVPITSVKDCPWPTTPPQLRWISDIIGRCLLKNPALRYPSAVDLAAELQMLPDMGQFYPWRTRQRHVQIRLCGQVLRTVKHLKWVAFSLILVVLITLLWRASSSYPSRADFVQLVINYETYRAASFDQSDMSKQAAFELRSKLDPSSALYSGASPKSFEWLCYRLAMGLKAMAEKDLPGCLKELDQCDFESADDVRIRFLGLRTKGLALALGPDADFIEAQKCFRRARESAPTYERVWQAESGEGMCFMRLALWKDAEQQFSSALRGYIKSIEGGHQAPVAFAEANLRASLIHVLQKLNDASSLARAYDECFNPVFEAAARPENGPGLTLTYGNTMVTKAKLGQQLRKLNPSQVVETLRQARNILERGKATYPKEEALFVPSLGEIDGLLKQDE